jgi:hypothetical protein
MSTATCKGHPTAMVGYLLGRELVGENQVEGGVTRFLARAGDSGMSGTVRSATRMLVCEITKQIMSA